MSTAMRMIWLFTLAGFSGGCSTYGVLTPQPASGEPGVPVAPVFPVKKGDEVRIMQHNDGKVSGKVITASPQSITVHVAKHNELFAVVGDSDQDVPIPTVTIHSLEKRSFSLGKTLVLIGAIALPIVVMGLSWESVDFGMEDGNWGSLGPYQ